MSEDRDGTRADDPTGSELPGRGLDRLSPRAQLALRVSGGVGAVLAFGLAVAVGVVFALDGSLSRVAVEGLSSGPPNTADTDVDAEATADLDRTSSMDVTIESDAPARTVLVLGSDSREVLTEEEREEYGTGMVWGERTEVVALVRIDAEADELRMVNIPRDSVVTRCDGSTGRINAAYGIGERNDRGGMSCVVRTVSAWSGLDIDHAVKVDFRGFVDIVDAIGGIEMFIEEPMRDQRANLDLQAGCQVLDGADALAFARARGLDNDFGRISRQQRLIAEMRDQVAEDGVFSEPVRTLRVAEAVASSMEVDSTLTLNTIRRLVMDHTETLQLPLDARTVPGSETTSRNGAWLLEPDQEAAAELFTWLLEGDDEVADDADDGTSAAAEGDADDTDGDSGSDTDDDASQATAGSGSSAGESSDARDDTPIGSEPRRCD